MNSKFPVANYLPATNDRTFTGLYGKCHMLFSASYSGFEDFKLKFKGPKFKLMQTRKFVLWKSFKSEVYAGRNLSNLEHMLRITGV